MRSGQMPSLWGMCQHKCYSQQAKTKKRRVARYVEDCNIILFSCVKRPLMMRTRRSFALKIVPKNFFFDFLNEVAVNENGFEWSVEVLFHNLEGYDGMLFWKNFSTTSYGRESSLCGNQTHICDIRSFHVRIVLFLSPSSISFPNFSLTCSTQVKIKITKDACDTFYHNCMRHDKRREFETWFHDKIRREFFF